MRELLFVILLVLPAATLKAQDPVAVNPGNFKVEIDNSRVRALRMKLGPHETAARHQHPASVVVYLTDSHERISGAGGASQEVSHRAGEVAYGEPTVHTVENISDQPLAAIVVELKAGANQPKAPPITLDPVKLDPQHHTVPFENERVRVLRTVLEPHLKSPMHEHPSYVVVYLTELHTTMTLGDGRTVDNPRKPGVVAWRDSYKHVTENIGDQTAVEIQIELK